MKELNLFSKGLTKCHVLLHKVEDSMYNETTMSSLLKIQDSPVRVHAAAREIVAWTGRA